MSTATTEKKIDSALLLLLLADLDRAKRDAELIRQQKLQQIAENNLQ